MPWSPDAFAGPDVNAQDPALDRRAHFRGLQVGRATARPASAWISSASATLMSAGRIAFMRGELGLGLVERVPRLLVLEGLVVEILTRAGRPVSRATTPGPGLFRRRGTRPRSGSISASWARTSSGLGPAFTCASLARATSTCACACSDGRLAAAVRVENGHDLAGLHPVPDLDQQPIDPSAVGAAAGSHRDHLALGSQAPRAH